MAASQNHEISAAETEIKRRGRRRLIGAITIGLLAIVFLPMIFDNESRRTGQPMKTQDISVLVPAKEGQPTLPPPSAAPANVPAPPVAVSPVADAPKAVDANVSKVADTPVAQVAGEKNSAKDVAKPVRKPDKPSKAETMPPSATGFVVQLGVYADAENAKLAVAKMKDAKLTVYTENIPIKSGNATRVRVGPFASRDKADAALAVVKLAGADGKIVPLK